MEGNNFIGLDIGSDKIAGISAELDKRGHFKVISNVLNHSEGFAAGIIENIPLAQQSILNVIYALEKQSGKNIKTIDITLSSIGAKSHYVHNEVNITDNYVSKNDIQKLIDKTVRDFKEPDQEIIHYFPIKFTLDNTQSTNEPIGMIGKILSCRLHIVTMPSNILNNLINFLTKCQVEVNNIVLGVYAAGLAILTEDEKKFGSIIIDCGAHTTSFGVFLDNNLIYASSLPYGSFHISSDITKAFALPLKIADKLKIIYSKAIAGHNEQPMNINLEDVDPEGNYMNGSLLNSADLDEVVQARIEEIFEDIKQEYNKLGLDPLIARRIVLTGGGAMLNHIEELVQKIFNKHTRIGQLPTLSGFEESYNANFYTNTFGLLKFSTTQTNQLQNLKKSGILNRIFKWFKANV